MTFLAGLTAMLRRYNGQPVPQWPHHITLNAAAALFVVVIEAMPLKTLDGSEKIIINCVEKLTDRRTGRSSDGSGTGMF